MTTETSTSFASMFSLSAAGFLAWMKIGSAWFFCLVCSLGVLLSPALWNGYALTFFDTCGYIEAVQRMQLVPGRSLFYGFFLWSTSLGWASFWGPVLVQSLCTLWLIHLMLRCYDLAAGPLATSSFCIGLACLTGSSWYTGQLMPDILVPLMVLSLWLLGFRRHRLGRIEQLGLAALALLGLLSHMSCMALGLGLILVILAAWMLSLKTRWPLPVSVLPPVAVVVLSLILMPALHLALTGKAGYTPGGPAFLFGRLVQDGLAQRWLAEHCPAPGIKLCALQDRLPTTADEFLWNGGSPFREIGGWTGAADAELQYLTRASITAYPGMLAWTSLRSTAQQMVQVATGDGLVAMHLDTRGLIAKLLADTAKPFNDSRQQQDKLTQSVFDALNKVHVPVAYLSILGLLVIVGWGTRTAQRDLAGLALFVLLALLGNAFICGVLSNPHDRYQSRLVWLASLVVGMALLRWRQRSSMRLTGGR